MAGRAVLCTDPSDFHTWKIVTKEKPTAPEGKVVIKMALVPVNPTDMLYPKMVGGLTGPGIEPNRVVIGSEGVGHVEEVGAHDTKVRKGQRVIPILIELFYQKGEGSWQDYVVAAEDEFYIIPDSIPDDLAAQFVINPWTAYGLVFDQKLSKGDYLLQGAAGSVLGRMVIQLAKHWGIKTINVVRWDDVKEELKKLGADEVINSSTEDVLERVKEITGGKLANGALDPVGGKATQVMASCVKNGGKVFIFGMLGSEDCTSTAIIFDLGRVNLRWWTPLEMIAEKTSDFLVNEISKLLLDKVIEPLSGKDFKVEEFKEALVESKRPGHGGKAFFACNKTVNL